MCPVARGVVGLCFTGSHEGITWERTLNNVVFAFCVSSLFPLETPQAVSVGSILPGTGSRPVSSGARGERGQPAVLSESPRGRVRGPRARAPRPGAPSVRPLGSGRPFSLGFSWALQATSGCTRVHTE